MEKFLKWKFNMKKIAHYPIVVYIFFFLITYVAGYFCGIENAMLRSVMAVTVAFVLSPRRKKIQTQTGVKTQITWIFLKESIILD